jgi:hypothetical protein
MALLTLNQGFSLNEDYAKSHQETVHLLITVYKHDKITFFTQTENKTVPTQINKIAQ